jgi:hypothetical protein
MPIVLGKTQPDTRGKVGTTHRFQGFSAMEIQNISHLQNQAAVK